MITQSNQYIAVLDTCVLAPDAALRHAAAAGRGSGLLHPEVDRRHSARTVINSSTSRKTPRRSRFCFTAIDEYVDRHNEAPQPFIWTASAGDILEKIKRAPQSPS